MESQKLRRYTDVASVLDMLLHKRINLTDPRGWADRNDAYGLERWRSRLGLEAVFVCCLADAQETWHHWQIYAGGSHGACIVFDRDALLDQLRDRPNVLFGAADYRWSAGLDAVEHGALDLLPFLKRAVFEDERELRILFKYKRTFPLDSVPLFRSLDIDLGCIDRIVISPLMPSALRDSVRDVMLSIPGCDQIRVTASMLPDNAVWRKRIDERFPPA